MNKTDQLLLQVCQRVADSSTLAQVRALCDRIRLELKSPNPEPYEVSRHLGALRQIGSKKGQEVADLCRKIEKSVEREVRLAPPRVGYGDLAYVYALAEEDEVSFEDVSRALENADAPAEFVSRVREAVRESLIRQYRKAVFGLERSAHKSDSAELESRVASLRESLEGFASRFRSGRNQGQDGD